MEESKKARKPNPRASANWLSSLSFWWTTRIFLRGYSKELEVDDLTEPLDEHRASKLGNLLERQWRREVASSKPSFFAALWRSFWPTFAWLSVVQVALELAVKVVQPLFLGRLLRYFTPDSDMSLHEASLYAAGVFIFSALFVLILHPYMQGVMHFGMKIRIAVCALVYRKTLRLSHVAMDETTAGQVLNLVSNDAGMFDMAPIFLNDVWLAPLELVICCVLMWSELGPSALIGVVTLLLSIPLQVYLGRMTRNFRLKTAVRTDERVRLMSEILAGVQVIKMYSWEAAFAKLVALARRTEMRSVRGAAQIRGVNKSLLMFSTRVSVMVSLIAHALLGNSITAEKVFVLTSYYNIIRHAMTMFFPQAITTIAECSVSIKRLQTFLLLDEASSVSHEHQEPTYYPVFSHVSGTSQSESSSSYHVTKPDQSEEPEHADKLELASADLGVRNLPRPRDRVAKRDTGVTLKSATAKWLRAEEATLNKVDLSVKPGQLVAIIGPVGAGKTSLLHAVLGELPLISGHLEVKGRLSYAAQQPWLFAGSLRQNITFGQPWDETRYRRVLRACALEADLKLMAHADRTVVGERGVQLSGGQRARVSLARAVYKQADIYLLDDPLSAVDAHVARHLFDECICRLLKNKCVLLVTHQLHFLAHASRIVVLESGNVRAAGTYSALQASSAVDLEQLLAWSEEAKEASSRKESESSDTAQYQDSRRLSVASTVSSVGKMSLREDDATHGQAELRTQGSVRGRVYARYLHASGGAVNVVLTLGFFLLTQLLASGSDFWLTFWTNLEDAKLALHRDTNTSIILNTSHVYWTNSTTLDDSQLATWLTRDVCMAVYSSLVLLVVVVALSRSAIFFRGCMRASQRLHDDMFSAISRATMAFFNNNPSGRILNRFSKDMGSIDEVLPQTMIDALQIGLTLLGIVTVVALVNVWMLIPTFLIAALFWMLRHVFLATSRSVKRLDGITRSPVYSHLSASLQGLVTIRAFEAQKILETQFDSHQDLNSSAWFLFISCSRAFGFWLDLVCSIYVGVVTFSFLGLAKTMGGNVGLAVTQAMGLTGMFQWGMRQSAELENHMTAVERVLEFCNLESEPPLESEKGNEPPKNWPLKGDIKFENLSLKYIPSETLVLNNISFHISPGEKIGIVGRTGAGKSSLISALFRLADCPNGRILIDDLDISNIGLRELRSKISIIPQEPVLFAGTLRSNLDPFHEFPDDALWRALHAVELREAVDELSNGLYAHMSTGGGNFSAGQKQLVCLARAILRDNKILVLDEATANVDLRTDSLIQKTIRTKFADCTVLTIAHRLNTVLDADRVLVMDAGRVLEFAPPHELLENPYSMFSQLSEQQNGGNKNSVFIPISITTYY